MEATSTRRAGLERFTFPKKTKPYFVLDLANDLPGSFAGGSMDIDPQKGRITLSGLWSSRQVLKLLCGRDTDTLTPASVRRVLSIRYSHAMM